MFYPDLLYQINYILSLSTITVSVMVKNYMVLCVCYDQ